MCFFIVWVGFGLFFSLENCLKIFLMHNCRSGWPAIFIVSGSGPILVIVRSS